LIRYVRSDLLAADVEALVNAVNCVGVMGKGLALQFKKAYPGNFKEYAAACKEGKVIPGSMFIRGYERIVRIPSLTLSILLIAWFALPVKANMGRISDGGSAHLLSDVSTVTMESEIINIFVGKELIKGDCLFKFVNRGPKCTVRMGFPDQVSKWKENRSGGAGGFLSFKTYVDGLEAKSECLPVERTGKYLIYNSWHACEVTFEEDSKREIRVVFSTRPSLRPITESTLDSKLVSYTLHTGGSWNGPITSSVVNFNFENEAAPKPLKAVDFTSFPDEDDYVRMWTKAPRGITVYHASKSPSINGSTLRFEFSNFKPTEKDDIVILYGRMKRREGIKFDAMVSAEEQAQLKE